jgi:hypothetical protein
MTASLTDRLTQIGWTEIANQLEALLEDAAKDSVPYSEFIDLPRPGTPSIKTKQAMIYIEFPSRTHKSN